MKRQRNKLNAILLSFVPLACDNDSGGSQVECGPGTALEDGLCLPECVPGSDGDGCVPTVGTFEFSLDERVSAYEALIDSVVEMDADDASGHLDQAALAVWGEAGLSQEQLEFIFDHGDELSEIDFKEADGVGSLMMPDGSPLSSRFSRAPAGGGFTGPNGSSCAGCHSAPISNSAGHIVANVMQDPEPLIEGSFNARQTISMQGGGLIQILAEDMTEELLDLKLEAVSDPGAVVNLVVADGKVDFGTLTCGNATSCDYTNVKGVSPDLVVRPMGWKGNFPTLRTVSADAAFGEMGMQPDELLWKMTTEPFGAATPDADGDGDGVTHELSVGDVTALTLYLAAQEMPTTVVELAELGLAELTETQLGDIEAGEALFEASAADGGVGCATCHVPEFRISTTEFVEPSSRAMGLYEDRDLVGRRVGYTSASPIVFDLSSEIADAPRVAKANDGSAVIRPYTDLKRHFMGEHLADDAKLYFPKAADQFERTEMPPDADPQSSELSMAIGLGEFLTPELWGVGNTGPWLHDGRALTLREAIMLHGETEPSGPPSEAQTSRDAFASLSAAEQDQVISFLLNLVLVEVPSL